MLEIHDSDFHEFSNDGEDHRRGDSEQGHTIRGPELPGEAPIGKS